MRKPLVLAVAAFVYFTCTCDGRERGNVALSAKEIMWKAWFFFIFFAREAKANVNALQIQFIFRRNFSTNVYGCSMVCVCVCAGKQRQLRCRCDRGVFSFHLYGKIS